MTADNAEVEITDALQNLDSDAFTSLHILDRVPAIFDTREQYASWRSILGSGLGVDPLCLLVVGSTAVGISLSPKRDKQFKPYNDGSDVDVAVVSPAHFEVAWKFLRDLGPLDKLKGRPYERNLLKWHRRSLIFDGTIATDRLLPYLPFGATWGSALGKAAGVAPTQDRDVKARIYRDFESLREYHRRNVETLRASIAPPAGAEKAAQE